ncbi:MAG TPA: DNA translocase FtsK [Verrucomicrobiae bacterium]|nr:DNA translocase FtsK [Verrucomicrobiae bacterium]
MAKKATADSSGGNGKGEFDDIIGFTLLVLALLLFISQVSYTPHDIRYLNNPPNHPVHNWIGKIGAYLGFLSFFLLGMAAYILPFLLATFGLSRLLDAMAHLRRHSWWSATCGFVLMVSLTGLLHLWRPPTVDRASAGGLLGTLSYGQNAHYDYGFSLLGPIGATIAYLALGGISLLFLTKFELGAWLNRLWESRAASPKVQEEVLERRARDLEKQARKLQEQVDKAGSGGSGAVGADLKPLPEPTVRDLSVPQNKSASSARAKKSGEPTVEPAPPDEGVVIPAREVAAATSAEILGKKASAASKSDEPKPVEAADAKAAADGKDTKPAEVLPEPVVKIDGAQRPKPRKPKPISVASTPGIGNYQLPSLDFLQQPDTTVKPTESREELMANARLMQQTLAQFDIEVSLGDITKGPTITRYELHPAPGVKLEKITALNNNIAAVLKAERINILAPVPGKSSVGVEVPNAIKTKVIMRDLLESEEWTNTKARIPLALGKDVYGHPIVADLGEMPHLLIAGSTGSGKSVCINAIITSLLYKFSPDQLRFVMIDPKVVELQQYNSLPHLVVPVVTDPKKVILALRWVVNEMEKRYQIFARVGVRNIKSFNERPKNKPLPPTEPELPLTSKKEKVEPGSDGFAVEVDEEIVIPDKLSYIVVIIDELADLMLVAPADVEMAIARITQMARAAGIHCIVATQRPSVDVITGVIKANIPARIAFQVAAKVDSRTILDAMGADKLLGKGDMLYLPPGSAKLIRAQGALITDQEIQQLVDFIAKQGKPSYEMEIHKQLSRPVVDPGDESGCDEDEDLIQQCIEVIRSEQKASVSLMQRRLRLGYTRAARIMDELENRGIVGPSKGAEPRDILIDLDGGGADGGPEPVHGK